MHSPDGEKRGATGDAGRSVNEKKMAKIIKISILISLAVMICACFSVNDNKNDGPQFYGDTFDWKNLGPIDFLEVLKNNQNEECPTYSIQGTHSDWVKKEHIPKLIALLDSKEPCANVCMTNKRVRSPFDC